jgi:hypothetical protein
MSDTTKQTTATQQPSTQPGAQSTAPQTRTLANQCWQNAQRHHTPDPNQVDTNTIKGWNHALALLGYLETKGATFIREDTGLLFVQIDKKTIRLDKPEELTLVELHDLEDLLFTHGLPGTRSVISKITVAYLQRIAHKCVSKDAAMSRFSAVSTDGARIYVPVADGLLSISKNGVQTTVNIENPDSVMVTPADGQKPFKFINEPPAEGLRLFEQLVIGVQTVVVPEMAWLAAMQEMLFPFIRDEYHGERMIPVHVGLSNAAKTGSEKPFVLLHGFEEATTKITAAKIYQIGASTGIEFLDNQEDHNLSDAIQDALITIASGGAKKTAMSQFGGSRPIVSMTTIESFSKPELLNRSVEIAHALSETEMLKFSAADHQKKLLAARDRIMSALMRVFVEFRRSFSAQNETVPTGAGKFSDNYRVLCGLLRAYESTAQKPDGWAGAIIETWHQQLADATPEKNEALGHIVRKFIDAHRSRAVVLKEDAQEPGSTRNLAEADLQIVDLPSGVLYSTTTSVLHHWAHEQGYRESMPRTPSALGKRLKEISTTELLVVRWEDVTPQRDTAPYKELAESPTAAAALQRGSKNDPRPVGFYVPNASRKG